jgi:alkylation response protein AidB-like acyl-CoA dehydrogenase
VIDPASATDEQRVDQLIDELLAAHDPKSTSAADFLGAQFDAGLAWVHFPVGNGGLDMRPQLQKLINERVFAAGGPSPYARNPIGYGMGAPTVVTHGSDAQKARYLRPLFTGEEIWCQLFSEPGAGSDVAGLATKAVRDGEEWIINGQKVWTTLAHLARWGMLVARTDPDQPKHKGMTYFALDMHAPGVEVRPLTQITGEAEFNEIFFTDVEVPVENVLGEPGQGWQVAMTTLTHERAALGFALAGAFEVAIGKLLELVRGRELDDRLRDLIATSWIELQALKWTNYRALTRLVETGAPGPEASIPKLHWSESNQRLGKLALELLGPESQLTGGDGYWQWLQLRSRGNTIEAGTSEILRNIVAERVLGLPKGR